MTDSAPSSEMATQVRKVASLVGTARQMLAEGRMVDLNALEGKVRELAGAIERTPAGEGSALKGAVAAIVENLDRLESELTAQHRSLTTRAPR